MSTQLDAAELLNLLESTDPDVVAEIKTLILGNLQNIREPWLLNALVDSFAVSHSEKCLEIIACVSEPHDKHLFDRLLDFMKGNNKLQALTILGYIIRKQSPWLHKIVHHNILQYVIKCLKAGTDVPILMSGLLVITSLLPVIPITVGGYLTDIFDVFSRLSAFNFKKPGNVPDVYLIHLQVGIYSLFHRLYGMYPCHFLTYLRATYSRKENAQIFDKTIKPMLQRVRMHPLLVTASKQKEISRDRWKQLEVHDIIVDCAKLSLDLTEGTSEERRCPITGSEQQSVGFLSEHSHSIHETTTVTVTKTQMVSSAHGLYNGQAAAACQCQAPTTLGVVSSGESQAPWSPGEACGLSTPPLTPVTPRAEPTSALLIPPSQPAAGQTPQRMTPHTHVHESPLTVHADAQDKTVCTASDRHAKLQKRLSGFSLSLAGKLPTPTEGDSGSVPPSPLKPDFTSEPPLHVQKMQAIRKLSFQALEDRSSKEDEERLAAPLRVKLRDPPKGKNVAAMSQQTLPAPGPSIGRPATGDALEGSENIATPSIANLPKLIDTLDPDTEMIDDEVSAITSSELHGDTSSEGSDTPMHLPQSADLTAQSMANFMKNVNRIRFNSINIVNKNNWAAEPQKPAKSSRSRSCPSLENEVGDLEEDDVYRERSGSVKSDERDAQSEMSLHTVSAQGGGTITTGSTNGAAIIASCAETASTGSQTSFYVASGVGDDELDGAETVDPRIAFPYEQLFPMSLPFAPFIQCFYCMTKNRKSCANDGVNTAQGGEHKSVLGEKCQPFYAGFSPPDLLDRHLASGGDVHAKELSHIPLTSHGTVAWTHYGGATKSGSGLPPTDEIAILRGQIEMLHNQLMFERHKREIHAKRNRRLLGSIAKYTSLEEQNNAMKDQLRLQEIEIQSLKSALRDQQKKFQQLKTSETTRQQAQDTKSRIYRDDIATLGRIKEELQAKINTSNEQNEVLKGELQSADVHIFNLESDTRSLRIKSELSSGLQQQVGRLNKELLLMGELQQKYQQRLSASAFDQTCKPEMQFRLDSYKMELKNMKQNLDVKTTQMDGLKTRLAEMEEIVKSKDFAINEQKKRLEDTKSLHRCQLEALEAKYKCEKRVQQSLQMELLSLYNEIGRMSTPTRPCDMEPDAPAVPASASACEPLHEAARAPASAPAHLAFAHGIPPVDSALDIVAMADSDSSDPLRTPESDVAGNLL